MRISSFIIALLLIGLFVVVFTNFFGELGNHYTPDVAYNSTEWEAYNQIAELNNNTQQIRDKTDQINEQAGVLDVIGSYFSSAYDAFKLTKNSYSSFEAITNTAIEDSNLGVNADTFKTVLITIVLVLIFIAIVLSALIKTPL